MVGVTQVTVKEVDPINNLTQVVFPNQEIVSLPPEELFYSKTLEPIKRTRKTPPESAVTPQLAPTQPQSPSIPQPRSTPQPATSQQPSSGLQSPHSELEFATLILDNGLVLKIGSVYYVDSFDVPFIISRIFKPKSNNVFSVTCFRCRFSSDKTKIIDFDKDFVCTINSSYIFRSPNKAECSFSFSNTVSNLVYSAQSRLISCQVANL